jgi:iron(III) transport system ATP-binding protein
MVFQDYALFPHLTVRSNVAYGLAGQPRQRIAESVASVLELVGLTPLAGRYPHELSGGERQRAALARALAPSPVLLLLDEPFSSLDVDRRVTVREQVRAILRSQSATAIFVTHDHEEALFMGDRVAVINQGRLEQVGAPEQIFHAPVTRFVAEFMGRTDFLPGEVTAEGVLTEIGLLAQRMAAPLGTAVEVAIRADDVTFERDPASRALVLARHFKGAQNVYRLRLPSGRLLHSLQPHTFILPPGTPVHVRPNASHALACYHEGQWVPPAE